MKGHPQYLGYKDFIPSLKRLMQKGGNFQRAAETASAAWGRANAKDSFSHDEVFRGIALTNHGENRIANCVKYDLSGYSRLVTAHSKNICIFLFVGDHDAVDSWLDRNKGLDFVAKEDGAKLRVDPVFISDLGPGKHGLIHAETDLMSNGPVINTLHERYRTKLLAGLDESTIADIETIESHSEEDSILEVCGRIEDSNLSDTLLDVLLALKASDRIKAESRISLYEKSARNVVALTADEASQIVSSESTVRAEDVDPVLFEHFVRTANFRDWMLYLHPAQRDIVGRDFNGPARLAGVSGSGKTCVLIHRALRLARLDPTKNVLILTLNESLAKLISDLIDTEAGVSRPKNLAIKWVFELCAEKLHSFEPDKIDHYQKRTIKKNIHATSEHIDEIWDEYYQCHANNIDADAMFDVARTLLTRKIFPQDYLRQELDYVRSAFAPPERTRYLEMERTGRVIGLEKKYREAILRGLDGWEKKMRVVGAVDDIGIVTALYQHLEKLRAEYDHVLVDEVQDLGTLELRIIRRLTKPGQNDLFLCGDAAQTVHTKHSDMKAAEIDLPSARWINLKQNYRNSRQILTAAHTVLTRSFKDIPAGTVDLEILLPEYANFTSPSPLLLKSSSVQEELAMALSYVEERLSGTSEKKACIAFCGYSQSGVEELGKALQLQVLCGATDITSASVFLSDLEQTKGFEFDLMLVLNCGSGIIPHPDLPENESFRELCKLYVALTRAKTELIVSYSGEVSRFVKVAEEFFNISSWNEHEVHPKNIDQVSWPAPLLKTMGNMNHWRVAGREFLRFRESVGLSPQAQDEILSHVTGSVRTLAKASGRGARKIVQWKDFLSFYKDMMIPLNRSTVISDEIWTELKTRMDALVQPIPVIDNENSDQSSGSQNRTISNQRTSTGSEDRGPVSKPKRIVLYRHSQTLEFSPKQIHAHLLASLMAMQQVDQVRKLEIGLPMERAMLDFLMPRKTINEWLTKSRLRQVFNDATKITLTKSGWDACQNFIIDPSDVAATGRPTDKLHPDKVESYRQRILKGPDGIYRDETFAKKEFRIG